jgi:hypothetical protein
MLKDNMAEQRDSPAKAVKLLSHFKSNQPAHRISCQIERTVWLERDAVNVAMPRHDKSEFPS